MRAVDVDEEEAAVEERLFVRIDLVVSRPSPTGEGNVREEGGESTVEEVGSATSSLAMAKAFD